jgi:kynureninase
MVEPALTSDDLTREAVALDAGDPLAGYRGRFVVPDDDLIYLDGNSLGRAPLATVQRVNEVLTSEWAGGLIRSWDERWLDLPVRLGDLIGTGLLGARPGEVVVCDNTTTNLYKLVQAAMAIRPGRRVVIIDRDNFPTDRYVLEGVAADRGLVIRWIDDTGVDGPGPEHVADLIDEDVALVTLSHVAYQSAAIADMAAITEVAHEAGALTLWDLCHSAGAVPVDLTTAGADLAVGCTYKYLNGGPGAPAFLYVRDELRPELRQPIWGWWGRQEMFEMAQGYRPQPDIRSYLTGTPPVLALAAVEPGVAMLVEAGLPALRAKSTALTGFAVRVFDALLAPRGFTLGSPRDAAVRGGHVTVCHPDAGRLVRDLTAAGVLPDFRAPDGIRLGLAPLTTRFTDVSRGLARLAALAD